MWWLIIILSLQANTAAKTPEVRVVEASSCDAVVVNVALGMTTQIIFDQKPRTTLFADKKHFRIETHASSERSVAIIPVITGSEVDSFRSETGALPDDKVLANFLDESFRTNLFIFFDHNNQLMFQLRFVAKKKADYVLKVKQVFPESCRL